MSRDWHFSARFTLFTTIIFFPASVIIIENCNKMRSNTLSAKPVQNVNTHSKYEYTFWYNLNL